MQIRIFTNKKFTGYYPVGTAAVVIAESEKDAADHLNRHLTEMGLNKTSPEDFEEMPIKEGEVRILNDGNY